MSELASVQSPRNELARARGRRWFLSALFGTVSLAPSFAMMRTPRSEVVRVEEWLRRYGADVLGGTVALSRFGAVYLTEHPWERDREHLARLLAGDGTKPVGLSLVAGIARDWRQHDVVTVSGWVCARTEARVCAALHLMSGARA